MWLTNEVLNYLSFDGARDSWGASASVVTYIGGNNPTISVSYGGSAAAILGFDGTVSLNFPVKMIKK
jgi:hypothetical protein